MPQLLAGFLSLLTLQYRPQCRVHLAPADIVCKNWVQSARFSKSVGGGRDFSLVSGGAVELVSASCALGGVPEAVGHVAQLFANGHTVNETKQSTSFCASYHELTGLKGAHPSFSRRFICCQLLTCAAESQQQVSRPSPKIGFVLKEGTP